LYLRSRQRQEAGGRPLRTWVSSRTIIYEKHQNKVRVAANMVRTGQTINTYRISVAGPDGK